MYLPSKHITNLELTIQYSSSPYLVLLGARYLSEVQNSLKRVTQAVMTSKHSLLNHVVWSHVADANTESGVSDPATFIPSLPVALLQTNLLWIGCLGHSPTPVALVPMLRAGWLEDGRCLRLGHFVEESKVRYIFARWGKGDYGGEFIAPEDLIRQVGGSDLAGGGGRFNCSTHDHH